MNKIKLPDNYDPYAIVQLKTEKKTHHEAIDYFNDLKKAKMLDKISFSGNRITQIESVWDMATPFIINSIWNFIDAIEHKFDKMLINYFIEYLADSENEIEEVTCSLLALSFAWPCIRAINDEYKLHISWDGPVMLAVSFWSSLAGKKSFVDAMQEQLLCKRENIFCRVPQVMALNTYALLLNNAIFNEDADKSHLKEYITKYTISDFSLLGFCGLLDNYSFQSEIPFFGGHKLRTFYESENYTNTQEYFKRKYSSFEYIDHYIEQIKICSDKLENRWGGSLLDGDAWEMMHAP